jgi:hypothetical protein
MQLFEHYLSIYRRSDSTNSSEMTLESFMQSRQDERRVQHPHIAMRVPQYIAPPPPPGDNNIIINKIRLYVFSYTPY